MEKPLFVYLALFLFVSSNNYCLAQGSVSYSYNTAGDLTQRSASGGEERSSVSMSISDRLTSNLRKQDNYGISSDNKANNRLDSLYAKASNYWYRLRSAPDSVYTLDTTLSLGQVPISSSVTQTGARTYSVSVPVSSNCRLTPAVSLEYNSQSVNGEAGFGWRIGGISSITIRNKNAYYDSITRPARFYDATQRYSLDGITLVPERISGIAAYDFETVTGHILVKKIKNSEEMTVGFLALYPDGRKAIYGFPDDSIVSSIYPLTEITSSLGEKIKYTYSSGNPPYYVERIVYGNNLEDTIRFSYAARDTIALTPIMAWQAVNPNRILSSITSIHNHSILSVDSLSYRNSYGSYLLERITRSRGGQALNPLLFEYGRGDIEGEYYSKNAPELDTVVEIGGFTLPITFRKGPLMYVRGKMQVGSYDDGLIILPKLSTYYPTDTSWFDTHHYDSQYDSTQQILVYPSVIDGMDLPLTLTAGSGFKNIQAVDLYGSGKDEIVSVNVRLISNDTYAFIHRYSLVPPSPSSGQWSYIHKCDTVFFDDSYLEGFYRSPVDVRVFYGDFTGCGKSQVLLSDPLNGEARILEFSNSTASATIVFSGQLYTPSQEGGLFLCQDIDSDGMTDICLTNGTSFRKKGISGISTAFTSQVIFGIDSGVFSNFLTSGDLNGDGYFDIIYGSQGAPGLFCAQYVGSSFIQRTLLPNYTVSSDTELVIMDVNRDGLGDILSATGRYLSIYVNNNGTFSSSPSMRITKSRKVNLIPNNLLFQGEESCIFASDLYEITGYKYASDRSKLRLVARMIDSFGNTVDDEYTSITENQETFVVVESDYSPTNGYCLRSFPLNVVSETMSYPYRKDHQSSYSSYLYTNAVVNQNGLGFMGFQKYVSTDILDQTLGIDPIYSEITFDPENSSVPIKIVKRICGEDGEMIDSTANHYAKVFHQYKKYLPRLDTTITVDAVGGFRYFSRYVYDSLDFVAQQYSVKEALDTISSAPGAYVEKWTGIRYGHQISLSDSLWLLGNILAATEDVTDYAHLPNLQFWETVTENTYSRGSSLPDTTRRYVGMTDQIEGPVEAENLLSETRYTYDGHGNVTSKFSAAYGATDLRGTHYTYDADGRFLLSETDAAGLTTTYSGYNLFGKPTSVTDPRGNVTTYTYDNWGNPLTSASPDGQRDTVIRRWAVNDAIGSLYSVTTRSNASPEQTTWYNSLGQEVRTAVKHFDGSTVITDRQYSNGGRLLRESLPRRDTAQTILWNTTSYDTLGRVVSVTAASGAQTLYHYDGRRTITTSEGISSRKTVGADGNVIKSEDIGGEIQYYYRPDGQPDSVRVLAAGTEANPVWATTRFTYDAYGRRTSIIDPSAGTRSDAYTDNADGSSSILHTTANGTVTTYCDTLGRVTRIQRHDICTPPRPEEPEERSRLSAADPSSLRSTDFTTDYKYNAYGDLLSARSNNGTSTHYAYDTLGRVVTQRDSVPGNHWLQKGFSYDTTGRIASTAYTTKSGISVTESYTYTNGYHTKTTARDTTIWELLSENALGQPTLAQTGTAGRGYSYDAYGFPTGRSIWNDQDELTMDFRYGYNHPTGNMTYREDRMHYISGNTYAREAFTYDALNRLTEMGDNLLPGANARNVTYSRSGNIKSISGSGTFAYADSLHHPYQVTSGSVGGDAWCPDPALTAGYTSYDRPMYIDGNSGQVEFTYNDAGERVMARYGKYTTGEELYQPIWNRTYIGGQYEREVEGNKTRETLWLGGDAYSAPMIFYRENNTGGALYNIGRDVQGSITHLATVNGDLLKEYSYDPWGRQRNPSTHAFPTYGPLPDGGDDDEEEERSLASTVIPVLHRGYCGHEYIEPFGLINMNARLYDPFNGRFFSPDPYVQAPDFSQNFNRYAYCLNNPLKYNDKNGEFFVIDSFIIGLLSGGFEKGKQMGRNDFRIWKGLFVTDETKSIIGRAWELVSRFTWQLPQTIGGFLTAHSFNTFGLNGGVESVNYAYGATVVQTGKKGGWGITQGNFIVGANEIAADPNNSLFQHEYGHYLQSQEMGLGYYSRVGIPSILSRSAERHRFHPVEQDANRRAFQYFSKHIEGFYENSLDPLSNLGWHLDYYDNPIIVNGVSLSLTSYASSDDVWALFDSMTIRASVFDILGWCIPPAGTLLTGLMNAAYYNFYRY